ncbi:uncharacterized protein LOC111627146 [Centruroides sculpturatus]|uniref:uncharacterized protein LOC111627146 n=1 Tax=Centruroides sculpturatus TaxID=218467 RepID=UPI000C6C8ED8|nr:uncharacterized protein LOC111627146 [Centruroides sculpturatus]
MTFSGGALDLIIYGAIPVAKGTYFWWAILIGLVYIPIYFFAFYFAIKRFNLPTPGRGENAVLYTKADYQAQQSSRHGPQPGQSTDRQVNLVVEGFGGWDNIKTYTNCASRLRYDVYDPAKVNESKFKQAGAFGVQKVGQHHYQIIFGPASEQINAKIMAARGKTMAVSTPTFEKQKTASSETVKLTKIDVKGVVPGRSMSLKSLKDGVFSEKIMGDGLAIMPKVSSKQIFYAPISGKLVTVFPTGHAYGIQNSQGVSVLVHIGIDTVNLRGEGFKSLVRQDQVVTAGDPLAEVNLTLVKKKAPSIATVVVLTPDSKGKAKSIMASGQNVNQASTIFKVS